MFKKFIENLKAKVNAYKRAEIQEMWTAVRAALIKKYEIKELRDGGVNISAFTLADQEMEKIKTRKILERYYDVYVKHSKRV